MPETTIPDLDLVQLAGDLVCAYVANNVVPSKDLPALLTTVHGSLMALASPDTATDTPSEPDVEKPTPAQIRKSIRDDGLVSFVDGRTYKTLKRHLGTHGLDPYSYRQRYGLPADYPMVAPSYAARRSELAKAIGLGRPVAPAERRAAE